MNTMATDGEVEEWEKVKGDEKRRKKEAGKLSTTPIRISEEHPNSFKDVQIKQAHTHTAEKQPVIQRKTNPSSYFHSLSLAEVFTLL
ncbi:uncharacterized [Tachysurus ichikawai]